MVNQPLELITDPTIHLFFENGIRGGISMISKRYALANNKYLKIFNVDESSKYIMYLDANNLYGWAMCQPLPVGDFTWIDPEKVDSNWIQSIPEDSETGYVLEVDLHYPPEVHDLHNDYPLGPENMKITFDDLSPFSKNLLTDGKFHPSTKLVPNLKEI